MTTKLTFHKHLSLLLLALLTACGTVTPASTPTVNSATQMAKVKTVAAATISIQQTQIAIDLTTTPQSPTKTPNGTPTRWSVQFSPTPTITPTPAPPQPFSLAGYVMVFLKDGNLYFQDENNTPVQLTHGGDAPHSPMISDDNQKIVFFRNDYSEIYSVNANGSQEKKLVSKRSLPENWYGGATQAFIPGSHKLLYSTYKCERKEEGQLCAVGISLVDTDTGTIKRLVAPGTTEKLNHDGIFRVSPDGTMVSVASIGRIDIYDMNGQIVRKNVLPYTPSTSYTLFPKQFWLPDSSGLIVAVPDATFDSVAYGNMSVYTVWRYTIGTDTSSIIPITPVPICGFFEVSPDGNWVFYGSSVLYEPETYIGNLINAQTQFLVNHPSFHPVISWSPNSEHFIYSQSNLGSVVMDKPSIHLEGPFTGWIDAKHFTFLSEKQRDGKNYRTLIGEIDGLAIRFYVLLNHDAASIQVIKLK